MARDFKKIRAWVLADELTLQVYGLTSNFPWTERFGLVSQMRRASFSIAANIAEGANRSSKKEYLQFLSIAAGSVAETRYFLGLSRRLGYGDNGKLAAAIALADETGRTI